MNTRWLLRLAKWARNPPSTRRMVMMLVIAGVALAIAATEQAGWWPDWAHLPQTRMDGPPR